MDLGLNETQQMLKNSAREFLLTECPDTYVRAMENDESGYATEIWDKIAGQGWIGLMFPETYGGFGLSFLELTILLEEMGKVMFPGPFFSTVIGGGLTLLIGGNEQQKQIFIPKICEGKLIVSIAINEPNSYWDPGSINTISKEFGDKYIINGRKSFVDNAYISDYIIIAAKTGPSDNDISLFIAPSKSDGINQALLKTIGSDKKSELSITNLELDKDALIGDINQGWNYIKKIQEFGAIGKCAEMSGGSQEVLSMTVEYAKQRIQFGRPIGSFQAIQHHCANMAIDVEGIKYLTHQAAWKLSEGLNASREVAIAKAWSSDAYQRICALGQVCHGAIGYTKEHNMQMYTRRAKSAELAYGDSKYHLQNIENIIGF
jgi:alkylation response protein AidB-like acyl-CoA dehydrogenase